MNDTPSSLITDTHGTVISFKANDKVLVELDRVAVELETSRSALIRQFIRDGLRDHYRKAAA